MKNLKMKNGMIKLSAVLCFIFLSSAAVALGNDGREDLSVNNAGIIETQNTIRQHISFPNIILPIAKIEKVEVVFTTDEKGKVNFVLAKTNNDVLKQQLEKQFSEMVLTKIKSNVARPNDVQSGVAYSIVFNIKKV
jgi:hypothetical protein